jgi:hypothetical protein
MPALGTTNQRDASTLRINFLVRFPFTRVAACANFKKGVTLALIVVPVRHQGDLERMGLIELIGANHIFESRQACLAAYQSERARAK